MQSQMIEAFLKELERTKQAVELFQQAITLLEDVYVDIGPYGLGKPSPETLQKLNEFFSHDDGE